MSNEEIKLEFSYLGFLNEKIVINANEDHIINRVVVTDMMKNNTNGSVLISDTNQNKVTIEFKSQFLKGLWFRIEIY